MVSVVETELTGLFCYNWQEATMLYNTLMEIGNPKPTTPIMIENSTAIGIANNNEKLRRSRSNDKHFH